jgi:hypothetical protein
MLNLSVEEYRDSLMFGPVALGEPACSRLIDGQEIANGLYPDLAKTDLQSALEQVLGYKIGKEPVVEIEPVDEFAESVTAGTWAS